MKNFLLMTHEQIRNNLHVGLIYEKERGRYFAVGQDIEIIESIEVPKKLYKYPADQEVHDAIEKYRKAGKTNEDHER